MLKTKRKMTLTEMVTSIVAIIISLLGVVIYISIASRVVSMIDVSQEQNINREIEYIKAQLISYTSVFEIILHETASSPIMTQAVMQPEYTMGNLKDFIDELKILNQRFSISLLDYRGEKIYSNDIGINRDYTDTIWLNDLMTKSISAYKGVSSIDGHHYWTVAVPVTYNQFVEGALIAELPMNSVFNYNNIGSQMEGIEIQIIKDNNVILTVGDMPDGWIVEDFIEELGIALEFTIDQSATQTMLVTLKSTLLFILMSFIALAVGILIFVSKKYIIKPITDLKDMISEFMLKGTVEDQVPEVAIVEIEELTYQYVEMSHLIDQREAALIVSEQTLIRKNEKIESLLKQLESTQSLIVQQEKLASIGRLAAGVAHELNSPIGFVNGNFDVLKEYIPILLAYIHYLKTGENPDKVDFDDIDYVIFDVSEIIMESDEGFSRIIEIVRNLKEYSRIDKVKTDAYDLNKGIRTTLMVAKNEYKYIAQIEEDLGNLSEIPANGSEINEVLLNIIVNAAQALDSFESSEEKIIRIKSFENGDYVCCEITDNGPGIDKDVIDKIYDPFFTTKEPGKGTGLGLNIAYNIINNKHNGELSVRSELGQGTTFVIKLPK